MYITLTTIIFTSLTSTFTAPGTTSPLWHKSYMVAGGKSNKVLNLTSLPRQSRVIFAPCSNRTTCGFAVLRPRPTGDGQRVSAVKSKKWWGWLVCQCQGTCRTPQARQWITEDGASTLPRPKHWVSKKRTN